MDNNDILIRLRYALDLKNKQVEEIFNYGDVEVTRVDVTKLLTKSDQDVYDEPESEEHMRCTNSMLEGFLNGLIIFKRGRQTPKPGQSTKPDRSIKNNSSVNNVMLKKVKIALTLTSDDIVDILDKSGVTITKGEISALLRKEGHKNYKECGDRYARNFLKGLAIKYRG